MRLLYSKPLMFIIMLLVAIITIATGPSLPAAQAAQPSSAQELLDAGVITDGTRADNTDDWLDGFDAIVILTPGTDDGTLVERTNGIVGTRTTYVVQYPESFWPLISGKSGAFLPLFAPTYDKSSQVAVNNNLAVMRALHANPPSVPVIYTGYSQGAEAVGNVAEQGYAEGLLGDGDIILLVSDPRSPWGAKQWLAGLPVLPQLSGLIGITSNGARNPGATGDVNVHSVILTGDPAANMQWLWYRPVSSMLVNAAGFLTVHSGRGPQHYGVIPELGEPTTYTSEDGNTTYLVYDTKHPLALFNAMVWDTVGLKYSDSDLNRWDQYAEAFYPLQKPTPGNAAVPVKPAPANQQDDPIIVADPQDDEEAVEAVEPVMATVVQDNEVTPQDDVEETTSVELGDDTSDDSTVDVVTGDESSNDEAPASDYDLAG